LDCFCHKLPPLEPACRHLATRHAE
ncbi:hypothetical protein A2U01_0102287, partial [Trifolium medium]|nr:hypothetical protein [Trifolium medium]